MTTYLPFLLSFFIGYFIVDLHLKKSKNINPFLKCFLSVGIGLGVSSLLTFFSFVMGDGFHPLMIFTINVCLFIFLMILYGKTNHGRLNFSLKFDRFLLEYAVYIVAFAFLSVLVFNFGHIHPFGEWDAWAVWNMKAKFLVLNDYDWKDAFKKLHRHTQPDYPLLLPCINIWGWTLSRMDFSRIPFLTSVIFTVSCAGLLFGGLMRYGHPLMALLISFLLLSLPPYAFLGTAQYADVVLAYYLLASYICLLAVLRENDKGFAGLLGLFLGLMSFTKNEGVLMATLIFGLSLLSLLRGRSKGQIPSSQIIPAISVGFLATLPATIIFKLFFAPPNRDIVFPNFAASKFFNLEGFYVVWTSLMQKLSATPWQHTWAVLMLAVVLGWRRFFDREIKFLVVFLLLYLMILFVIYLGTPHFDLGWRLSRTLPRILFYLLPSYLFVAFYAYGKETFQK